MQVQEADLPFSAEGFLAVHVIQPVRLDPGTGTSVPGSTWLGRGSLRKNVEIPPGILVMWSLQIIPCFL